MLQPQILHSYYLSLRLLQPQTLRRLLQQFCTVPPVEAADRPRTRLETVAFSAGLLTVVPVIPYLLWAVLEITGAGGWLTARMPASLHPLLLAYVAAAGLTLLLFALGYLAQRLGRRRQPLAGMMSLDQTLFYHAFAAYDHLQAFEVNGLASHLEQAAYQLHRLGLVVAPLLQVESWLAGVQFSPESRRLVRAVQETVLRGHCGACNPEDHSKVTELLLSLSTSLYVRIPELERLHRAEALQLIRSEGERTLADLEEKLHELVAAAPTAGVVAAEPVRTGAGREVRRVWQMARETAKGVAVGLVTLLALSAAPLAFVYFTVDERARDALLIAWFSATMAGAISLGQRFIGRNS